MDWKPFIIYILLMLGMNNWGFTQKYVAEVIDYSTSCEVSSNRLTTTEFMTIIINNRAGDEYGIFHIPYSKNVEISNLNAWIEDVDGNVIRKLKKDDIIDNSAIPEMSLYADYFDKKFQLKHSIYPYIVKCTYQLTQKDFLSISNWAPVVSHEIPTRNAELKVILPKGYKYKEYLRNVDIGRIDSVGDQLILQWNTSYLKPIKEEIFSQPVNFIPRIIVVPLDFRYGIEGSYQDWKSFGNYINGLMQDMDELPDEEKIMISTLTRGITDKREIVKVLYHYLQDNTRYINVSIGIGGLKPYPASYVARNKYGDCKALTNYMKAMLSYAGIESFYTLVNSGDQSVDLLKDFVFQQFDHVVLTVPLDNDTIWLENTNNVNPFGYMGTFTQNRYALLIANNNSHLIRIPALTKEQSTETNRMEFELSTNGMAHLEIDNSYKGNDFETYNQIHSQFNQDDKDRIIRQIMMFDNYEVVNWEIEPMGRDSARIELHASLLLSKFLNPLGEDFYYTLNPITIPRFTNPVNRTLPVVMPYPICIMDTLKYNLPDGFGLKTIPEPVISESPFGKYELVVSGDSQIVTATKKFELYAGDYSLETYPEFYKFLESVKKSDKIKIVIKQL